jgi:ACS family hexuronate transporter-like MFS transporter
MKRMQASRSRFQAFLVLLLFWVAVINYFDRQSLSVVAPFFQAELHLSDAGYSHIVTAFMFASAIAYAITGFISDRLGTRVSMGLFVGWWSLAEALTAFVHSSPMLAITRFMLGLGEPGLWVAAPKAVAEFFEKEKRAAAIGLYTMGATVGAVIALPIIVAVTTHLPWRTIFLFDGVTGLLWLPLWFLCLRGHDRPASESSSQPHPIAQVSVRKIGGWSSFREVLSVRRTWQLLLARAITDPVWYFYLFWFPKYLGTAQHLNLQQIARTGWWVYLAAGVGTLLGGTFAGLAIKRGHKPVMAYRKIMAFSAMLVPLSPLAAIQGRPGLAIAIGAIVAMAHMCWLVNLTSMVVELFPLTRVATATGIVAAGSALGGMAFSEIIGYVVTYHGYFPLFWIMGCAHPIALAIMWTSVRPAGKTTQVAGTSLEGHAVGYEPYMQ